MQLLLEVWTDALLDSLKMLPFLFAAFLLIEGLERYSTEFLDRMFTKLSLAGPLAGAVFGCIPQCGFSVMAANLYSGGILSLGTLMSVFLATSDEAVLIILGHPSQAGMVWRLLGVKLLIAVAVGYLTDLSPLKKIAGHKHRIGELCEHDHCGCHDDHGILMPAIRHTLKLFFYIFLFSGILNLLIELTGLGALSSFLLRGSILQPFLTALIGFIPNCAASVLLTELYLNGALSFASVIAGLCTNAGVGLIVLFRENPDRRENLRIMGLLYAAAVISGLILSF